MIFRLSLLFLICTWNVSSCVGERQTSSFTREERRQIADKFISKMNHSGFDVGEGYLWNLQLKHCALLIQLGFQCFNNNPTTPYGAYIIPKIENEYVDDDVLGFHIGEKEDWFVGEHRIRGDEAIVYFSETPPESAYYGYTHHTMTRKINSTTGDGFENVQIFGSLSDTLNPMNIKLDRSTNGSYEDSFEKDVVIVATPHRDVYEAVERTFNEIGVSSDIINLQAISPELFKWGLGKESDTLMFLNRVALVTDEDKNEAYLNDPPAIIMRVTPKVEMIVTDPYEKPIRAEKTIDTNESYLEESLEALGSSIWETYSPHIVATPDLEVDELVLLGEECILNGTECYGDNNDATYGIAFPAYPMNDDQFYVVAGVNHMRSNTEAIYSSVSIGCLSKGIGIVDFNSVENMDGSSYAYLDEGYVNRDSLYVGTVRRNCTGYDHCAELGYGTLGLPEDEPPNFIFRAYLHANGTVAAPFDALLVDKIFFVDPTLDDKTVNVEKDKSARDMLRSHSSVQKG